MSSSPETPVVVRMFLVFAALGMLSLMSVGAANDILRAQTEAGSDTTGVSEAFELTITEPTLTTPTITEPATTSTGPAPAIPKASPPPTTVPPTTSPPPPVYKLDEYEGANFRFNPCQNPITIVLNPRTYLDDETVWRVSTFLNEQAVELSSLTGMAIVFGGLTDEVSEDKYKSGERILLDVAMPGEGVIDTGFTGVFTYHISWDRTSRTFREMDVVQAQISADHVDIFAGVGYADTGKPILMRILGLSLGLSYVFDEDMIAAGSTDESHWRSEIMYWSDVPYPQVWGPGDRAGLAAVGASQGCF